MELLATVDWLIHHDKIAQEASALRAALHKWPGGAAAGDRKLKLFDERVLNIAIESLKASEIADRGGDRVAKT
jgi:hypothetical protein